LVNDEAIDFSDLEIEGNAKPIKKTQKTFFRRFLDFLRR
jgi:hypothetical protein